MKEGDFVLVDFVGKIKDSGEIFDLTIESVAKENGIYNSDASYRPMPVIIGSNMIVRGVEKELMNMNVGEKKKIVVKPEDGFGYRSEKLVKLLPISELRKQNIEPYPGQILTFNGLPAKVLAISGGRVKLDFNHFLAGKELEYELEVKKLLESVEEKVGAVVDIYLRAKDEIKVKFYDGVAEIFLKPEYDVPFEIRKNIVEVIKKWIKEVNKIKFIEEFE
ncbi:MAG: peptidylprolyl isomerase [Candidatus Aenigmarchaeota archaeon]|nr:peptidylprolyl isomerase [Candidatus Aenigmarchaeota archaeon]